MKMKAMKCCLLDILTSRKSIQTKLQYGCEGANKAPLIPEELWAIGVRRVIIFPWKSDHYQVSHILVDDPTPMYQWTTVTEIGGIYTLKRVGSGLSMVYSFQN